MRIFQKLTSVVGLLYVIAMAAETRKLRIFQKLTSVVGLLYVIAMAAETRNSHQ